MDVIELLVLYELIISVHSNPPPKFNDLVDSLICYHCPFLCPSPLGCFPSSSRHYTA